MEHEESSHCGYLLFGEFAISDYARVLVFVYFTVIFIYIDNLNDFSFVFKNRVSIS